MENDIDLSRINKETFDKAVDLLNAIIPFVKVVSPNKFVLEYKEGNTQFVRPYEIQFKYDDTRKEEANG